MSSDLCLLSLNDISREGLHRILSSEGFNVLLSCNNFQRIVEAAIDSDCSVVIDLPDGGPQVDAIKAIAAAHPGAKIAVLVEHFEMHSMIECFDAGVDGYIVKSMSSQPLTAALRLVALGKKVLPSELADMLSRYEGEHPMVIEHDKPRLEGTNLSARERDVLCCLMGGYSNKVIARELHVCEATIKVHVKAILRKLDVSNRTQAALWASARGFSNYSTAGHGQMKLVDG